MTVHCWWISEWRNHRSAGHIFPRNSCTSPRLNKKCASGSLWFVFQFRFSNRVRSPVLQLFWTILSLISQSLGRRYPQTTIEHTKLMKLTIFPLCVEICFSQGQLFSPSGIACSCLRSSYSRRSQSWGSLLGGWAFSIWSYRRSALRIFYPSLKSPARPDSILDSMDTQRARFGALWATICASASSLLAALQLDPPGSTMKWRRYTDLGLYSCDIAP